MKIGIGNSVEIFFYRIYAKVLFLKVKIAHILVGH